MRKSWRYSGGALASVVLGTAGATLTAQNGSQFKDWKTAAPGNAAQAKPRDTCASLVALTGYEFSVTRATIVQASSDAPEHCRVSGLIQPEVRFEVSLPTAWNGRLYMFGNGGYAGEALDAPARVATTRGALTRGFATAQTNTGHDAASEPLGTFASSPQKFLDYAYRGVHVTALTAKRILQAYYDAPLRHSYFDGCSTGGRQGLISAQRFPDDFDGIVVGAPVLNFSGTMIGYAITQRALAAAPISIDKLKVLGDLVYAKCDATDGVKDGLIDDPRKCGFRASTDVPRCANEVDGPACFTAAQIRTLEAIYSSTTGRGGEVFPGWPVGAEIAAPGPGGAATSAWVPWFVARAERPSDSSELRGDVLQEHGVWPAGAGIRLDRVQCRCGSRQAADGACRARRQGS